MPDYSKGKIYKLFSNYTSDIYIGSTIQPLSKRLDGHKQDWKLWKRGKKHYINSCDLFEKYDDIKIILIEDFNCERKEQLESRERYYIENSDCINTQIPCRTKKEYDQMYHQTQKYKDYSKEYVKRPEWIQKMKEKNKEKYICECGYELTKNHKLRHNKTLNHQQYLQNDIKNKQNIKSELYNCQCGVELTKGCKSRHERSQKHKTYILSQENNE